MMFLSIEVNYKHVANEVSFDINLLFMYLRVGICVWWVVIDGSVMRMPPVGSILIVGCFTSYFVVYEVLQAVKNQS